MTQSPLPRSRWALGAYHQQSSRSRADTTAGKTVIGQVNGRVGPDEAPRSGTLGTATDVTVLP